MWALGMFIEWAWVYIILLLFACMSAISVASDLLGTRPELVVPFLPGEAGSMRSAQPWGSRRPGLRPRLASGLYLVLLAGPNVVVAAESVYAIGRPEGPTIGCLSAAFLIVELLWSRYLWRRPRADKP